MFIFTDCSAKSVTNYVRILFGMNVCSFMNDLIQCQKLWCKRIQSKPKMYVRMV